MPTVPASAARRRASTPLFSVALLLGLCVLGACSDDPAPDLRDVRAEKVWQQFLREQPKTRTTFEQALRENGFAATRHANEGDRDGVRYQVRGIEAQSIFAAQEKDVDLALQVAGRVDTLEEGDFLTNFEQAFPGARKRLEEARKRVAPIVD